MALVDPAQAEQLKKLCRLKSKYGAKAVRADGVFFASKKEYQRWCQLKILQDLGEVRDLARQVTFHLKVNGFLICKYIADFTYTTKDDTRVVEDAKGFPTVDYKLKKKLMLAIHGVSIKET